MLSLNRFWLLVGLFSLQTSNLALANHPPVQSSADGPSQFYDSLKEKLGITYFSFFYGPGVHPDQLNYNPNQLGNPQNDGVYFQNQVSLRYKFSTHMAFDFQSRFNLILNNMAHSPNFSMLRWEAPRVGVSGKLASGEDWTLVGAINTDFPYYAPLPFSGYQAKNRTVILNPGMFANFQYNPKDSKWSVFSVINPRYFFYTNRNAAEPQMQLSGLIPQNKPELIISILPTVNYRLSPNSTLTVGTNIDYRKQVISSWNMFDASLISNGASKAWRFNAIPFNMGVTYTLSDSFILFPFISFYPIAIQRKDDTTGRQATFLEGTSIGMWLRGTLF